VLRCFPELSDGEKMTYTVLKSFAYVGPETFVGEETLSRARAVTVSTISRHLQRLIDVGLVKVRRRGQGRTNIWVIARIPREKLLAYLHEWRPNIQLPQNPQAKTSQDSQIKTSQDSQAEEQEGGEHKSKKTKRGGQPRSRGPGSPSTGAHARLTTDGQTPESAPRGGSESDIVENSGAELSTVSTNVENLAAIAAEAFGRASQQQSIATFLAGYDPVVVREALETVIQRLERGERIDNPIAYFYTVVKVMQAERDTADQQQTRGDDEKRAIAISWARSLLREWPLQQARDILMDTYGDPRFADDILRDLTE